MKRTALVFLCLIPMVLLGQTALITWADAIEVDEMPPVNMFGTFHPSVAALDNDRVAVSWMEANTQEGHVFVAFKEGDSFGNSANISGVYVADYWYDFRSPIQAHGDAFFAVYLDQGNPDVMITRKTSDNGENWQPSAMVTESLFGADVDKPSLAIDGEGHPHVGMLRETWTGTDVGAVCSLDYGDSYTSYILASDPIDGLPSSGPKLVIEDNYHYLFWFNSLDGQMQLCGALSTNNGATFDTVEVLVEDLGQETNVQVRAPEACIAGDKVALIWKSPVDNHLIQGLRVDKQTLSAGSLNTIVHDTTATFDHPTIAFGQSFIAIACTRTESDGGRRIFGGTMMEYENFSNDMLSSWSSLVDEDNKPFLCFNDGWHMAYFNHQTATINYKSGIGTVLSVEEHPKIEIEVFPNPANDYIRLEDGDIVNAPYRILDMNGREVDSGIIDSSSSIDIEALSSGTYQLIIQLERNIATSKFVVE